MKNIFYWLNISEYILIIISFLNLLISFNSGNLARPLFLLTLALLLNVVNRLYGEKRQRVKISSSLKKITQRLEKIESVIEKNQININRSALPINDSSSIINSYQEYLISMEKSIHDVIQYVNNSAFSTRIENLEKIIARLRQKIELLTVQDDDNDYFTVAFESQMPKSQLQIINKMNIFPQQTWHCVQTLSEHSESVTSIAFTPDAQFLASGSSDKTIKIWSLKDYQLLKSVEAHEQGLLCLDVVDIGHDNYYLATGSYDQTVKLWTLSRDTSSSIYLKNINNLTNHTGSIYGVVLDAEKNILISGSYDQTVKQWDLVTGKLICSSFDPLGPVYSVAVNGQRGLIASAGADGSISLWKLNTGEMVAFLSGNVSSVKSLTFSPNGNILLAGCVDGMIRLWRVTNDVLESKIEALPYQLIKAHSGHVTCLLFSENGDNFFSGGADGKVKVWLLSSFDNVGILTINRHNDHNHNRVLAIALSPDDELLTVGSIDGKITLWSRNN